LPLFRGRRVLNSYATLGPGLPAAPGGAVLPQKVTLAGGTGAIWWRQFPSAIIEAMQLTLSTVEARVLGALIEKEITTPEYYPLSLNALTNACNQKSNREPVMQLGEDEIRRALHHLESQSLVRSIAESRATKFEHRLQDAFNFYRPEVAIVCELLLRGPQTPGELRTRASRMHPFEDLASVHSALDRLAKREPPLVAVLPRQPGTKEARYAHLMGETRPAREIPEPGGGEEMHSGPEEAQSPRETVHVESLAGEVARLREEISELRAQFATFRKQFE
jgi:uncharacterized protein YceH (UPF0502 family)